MSQRSEMFGRLLRGAINSIATYEGKTAPVIEEELGSLIGLAGSAIQRYKSGHLPPEPRTIRIFAEAAIRRGYLSREWLQRFLHAARYAEGDQLLDELCPAPPTRQRPPRVYQNLPAPTYSQFIMRPEPFAEVLGGLSKRSSAVLIIGLGGNGKTSLAREVAGLCLRDDGQAPRFDAAVWASDKDRPGTTNLTTLLDTIARTLDYPGLAQLPHDQKRREVELLLRRQRVLLVLDNLETVTDDALVAWLLDLPEPSKALITTREYLRAFRRGGWPVELRGMRDDESLALIDERLRLLRMDRLVSDRAELEPLIAVTGGNPKAIELALGVVKYERRPLQQVVDDLHSARGDLFDDLFLRAWAVLDEAAQRALLAFTLFPASASSAALGAAADVQGFALDRALERLVDLALIDPVQHDLQREPRYLLHPLVRAFAAGRLRARPELEQAARSRWLAWYLQLAAQMSAHWYDTHALAMLDPEAENLAAAVAWAVEHGYDRETLQMTATLGYYYYVRGWWDAQLRTNQIRLAAARRAANQLEEGFTLLNMLRIYSLQGRIDAARELESAVESLMEQAAQNDSQRCSFLHGLAVCALSAGDSARGRALLDEVLRRSGVGDPYKHVRARNWMADSLLSEGRPDEAEPLFEQSLGESLQLNYHRAIIFCQLKLAQIQIQRGAVERADALLQASLGRAEATRDRRHLAMIHQTRATIDAARGDLQAAAQSRAMAADLFARLGIAGGEAQGG